MNYKIVIVVLLAIGIVGGVYIVSNKSDEQPVSQSATQDKTVEAQAKLEPTGIDRYEVYTGSILASSKGTKRVLFFHANWCSTCVEFERQIKAGGVPEGVTIIKANYDKEIKLKQRFKVNVQTTFLQLDDNDEVINRWPFGAGLSNDIAKLYEQLL